MVVQIELEEIEKWSFVNFEDNDIAWVSELKRSASGCLDTLRGTSISEIRELTIPAGEELGGKGPGKHVMISYNLGIKDKVTEMHEKLQQTGYKCWRDETDMPPGSMFSALSKAIQDSWAILICYTQKYQRSANCRKEAEYAENVFRKRDMLDQMLFVKFEDYEPDEWLGFILGSKLCYDVHSRKDAAVNDLIAHLKKFENPPTPDAPMPK